MENRFLLKQFKRKIIFAITVRISNLDELIKYIESMTLFAILYNSGYSALKIQNSTML